MYTCAICNKQFKSRLGSHIVTHNITIKQYYDKYMRQENEGICPICGKETTFLGLTKGYSEHCSIICKGKDHKVKEKVENTCLERFGTTNVFSSAYGKEKIKETMNSKYGVDSPQQNQEIRKKTEQTTITRYGGLGYASNEIKEKCDKTAIDLYGDSNPYKYGSELYKQAINTIYGVDNPQQNKDIQEKTKLTNIERYGCENPAQNEEIREKMYKTLWANGGYHRTENRCYEALLKKYPNAKREYKSDKYPYKCDFYIPEEDLYIELNAFYMHGGHYFDKDNPEDIKKVEEWQKQNTEQSLYAIKIWTQSDLEKKQCAEENQLNYRVFWNEEEFIEWLN